VVGCAYTQVGDHRDNVTTVEPTATYRVRTPTAHPVYENFRTEMFREVRERVPERLMFRVEGRKTLRGLRTRCA
jgi:hypothetical protein